MTNPPAPTRTLGQRAWFVLRPVLVVAVLVSIIVPFLAGFMFIRALTTAPCGGDGDPRAFDLPYEDVSFPSSAFKTDIKAFFIPPDAYNGVVVIVPPPYTGGRGSQLHEIAVLHKHGYGALTFESRSCMGHTISLGYAEVT